MKMIEIIIFISFIILISTQVKALALPSSFCDGGNLTSICWINSTKFLNSTEDVLSANNVIVNASGYLVNNTGISFFMNLTGNLTIDNLGLINLSTVNCTNRICEGGANLTITSQIINISGKVLLKGGLSGSGVSSVSGRGGNILINASNLYLSGIFDTSSADKDVVDGSIFGGGNAGDIIINASTVNISGVINASGGDGTQDICLNENSKRGSGGNINISAVDIYLNGRIITDIGNKGLFCSGNSVKAGSVFFNSTTSINIINPNSISSISSILGSLEIGSSAGSILFISKDINILGLLNISDSTANNGTITLNYNNTINLLQSNIQPPPFISKENEFGKIKFIDRISNYAYDKTINWMATTQTGVSLTSSTPSQSRTFRNIIESANLNYNGSFIRIKLQSDNLVSSTYYNLSIGERASQQNITNGTFLPLSFNGQSFINVSVGQAVYSDWINYTINKSKTYLITFFFNGGSLSQYDEVSTTNSYFLNGDFSGQLNWSSSPTSSTAIFATSEIETAQNKLDLNLSINITQRLISVNSDGSALNQSANLTYYNVTNTTLTRNSLPCSIFCQYISFINSILTFNVSQFTNYMANSLPNMTNISITPSPPVVGSDVRGHCNYSDLDNDIAGGNQTYFYLNNSVVNEANNTFTLLGGNITNNANITFSCRYNDTFDWGLWVNSSTVTVGDTIAPTISNQSISKISYTIDDKINITIVVIEINKVTVRTELNGTNYTMSLIDPSVSLYSLNPPLGIGYYNITNFYATDGSGNNIKDSSNITFRVTSIPSSPPISSGGGGSVRKEIQKPDCNIQFFPNNTILSQNNIVRKIELINNENFTLSPTFILNRSDLIEIKGELEKIVSLRNILEYSIIVSNISIFRNDIGIQDNYIDSLLTLKTNECKDITSNIKIQRMNFQSNLKNIKDFFNEEVTQLKISKIQSVSVKSYQIFALIFLLVAIPYIRGERFKNLNFLIKFILIVFTTSVISLLIKILIDLKK